MVTLPILTLKKVSLCACSIFACSLVPLDISVKQPRQHLRSMQGLLGWQDLADALLGGLGLAQDIGLKLDMTKHLVQAFT